MDHKSVGVGRIAICIAAMAGVFQPAFARGPIQRVIVIVLENEDESRAASQPFLAELAGRGALLRNFHAIGHPSQPNYIAMVAGATHGVTSDRNYDITARHLGDLLEEHGKTWRVYAEDYPGDCYTGRRQSKYVRKHTPFISFMNVQKNRARCNASIVNAAAFDVDVAANRLPNFVMYIPNLDNDGHDTGVKFADMWLRKRFTALLSDPRFMSGTIVIITFDEGRGSSKNIIYTAIIGDGVRPGVVSDARYDHYSLLRMIEDIFEIGTLHALDEKAQSIDDIWR